MPATIHAKICLSIKSRGDLKTAWIGFTQRIINFPHKAFVLCEKSYWKCQKIHFLGKITCSACQYASKNWKIGGFYVLLWFYNTKSERGTWRHVNWVNITIPTSSLLLKKMWQILIFWSLLVQMSHMSRICKDNTCVYDLQG